VKRMKGVRKRNEEKEHGGKSKKGPGRYENNLKRKKEGKKGGGGLGTDTSGEGCGCVGVVGDRKQRSRLWLFPERGFLLWEEKKKMSRRKNVVWGGPYWENSGNSAVPYLRLAGITLGGSVRPIILSFKPKKRGIRGGKGSRRAGGGPLIHEKMHSEFEQ